MSSCFSLGWLLVFTSHPCRLSVAYFTNQIRYWQATRMTSQTLKAMHAREQASPVMYSGKQTTARKMADQLKNCINQRAHGFYSNRIHTVGSVWITDTITNLMIHYNTSTQKCCACKRQLLKLSKWSKVKKKETKLLEAMFDAIKARLNGFSPFLQLVSVVV